ncbi:MAG: hypothetical protein V4677_05025, partial [Bacteroidota bacterium]
MFSRVSISQINLVTNPGFENHTTCPTFGGQINYCSSWNNVNLIYGNFTVGTPDYFHTCGSGNVVPPNTFAGQCNPHTGNAMTALVMYNSPYPGYREYMATPLSCPMIPGNTYTVSFWLTNGLNPISRYTIKNIGLHFSNLPLTQSGYSLISAIPQLELTTLVGSTNWVKYTFTVNPTSNWQHLTIGAFRPDSQNSPTSTYSITTGASSVYANYFFDDIEVLSSVSSGTISTTSANNAVLCFGASTASASVVASGSGPYNYLWSPGSYTTSVVNNLSAGIYTVTVTDGACSSQTVGITINQPPVLSPTLSVGSYSICKNSGTTLSVNNSGGTQPYTVNWNNGTTNAASISVGPLITSVYNYTVSDANNCVKTQSVQITVDSTIANFNSSIAPCSSLMSFTNTSLNGNSAYWLFGDGQSSSSVLTASNNYSNGGTYTVSLVSISSVGCKDT